MDEPRNNKYTVLFDPADIKAVDARGESYNEPLTNEIQGEAMMYTLGVCKANIAQPYIFAHCLSAALCQAGVLAIVRRIPEMRGPMEVVYSMSQINGHTGELEHVFNVMCAFERVNTFTASIVDDKVMRYPMTPATR